MPSTDWRSTGTALPAAALAQLASRNSSLVATRSWARVRTRSGSASTHDRARRAARRARDSMPSTSAGASDSMPSTAMPSASLASMSATPGSCVGQLGGPRADGVGEQQLAARRGPQAVLGDLEAALVGDLEPADLLDGVAPELDADRVLLGGREDVEDAAAHGELAAPLDQVGARVGRAGEGLDDVLESGARRRPQRDRHEVAEPLGQGWSTARTGATTTDSGPYAGSSGSGCASRRSTASRRPTVSLRGREPLVRQGLPATGRRRRASRGRKQPQRRGEVLGLARRRRDDERAGRAAWPALRPRRERRRRGTAGLPSLAETSTSRARPTWSSTWRGVCSACQASRSPDR